MQKVQIKKTKWELKRDRLMQSETYRHIIRMIEGDAEMLHRINLSLLVEKTHPGKKYSPLSLTQCGCTEVRKYFYEMLKEFFFGMG